MNAAIATISELGKRAKVASRHMACATTEAKNAALTGAANALRQATPRLIEANRADVATVADTRPASFIDRLMLDEQRIEAMAAALEDIAGLADPVGRKLAEVDRPNGLRIERVAVPIGVIGMIYESRPNVGADASALCLKSGNAIILRGGSESRNSTREIVACMREGLRSAALPEDAVQAVETTDRAAVTELLHAVDYIDLVIPRGGRGLVELVRDQAKVPTLLHLDGNCHSYVHGDADLDKAASIIRNAKMRRTGICGATESIVIDRGVAGRLVPMLADAMPDCELRGDAEVVAIDKRIAPATADDFGTEYLEAIASIKIVDGLEEAISFIGTHSSNHTDAIITENQDAANRFMAAVDSAIVMHNASTQFADGGEFGMGAEIGIATGKMHARGPVGLEQLTSFKYLVHGTGQTRP
ncbi:glutamate-5-semialdehyde dehydrogenase [Pontixanthobacter aquaemixtae]|uniref:Gamma-glutamyl phosphate reductase n=1 Tax=Pontixanthobacter aquaemixtae TaxID=1958940 RepID=A0A844ZY23_9SPHN|nr:glutamate-5-semialdehyde dehydrogenase [Pontixanthobacter aquaemixtae]MXO91836.1 glutamate-5-semialdehyde dehydrogenase [Pontixanthobacter aquaemixtae]